MPREQEISVNERNFVLEALSQGYRLDGRELDAYRSIKLDFADDRFGVVDLHWGDTRVSVQVSCSVTQPYADRKFDGIFSISTELSPMASPSFEVDRSTYLETHISRLLEKTIRRSHALDTESLCLVAGQRCFHIRADIHVLAHDGNLLDAACFALLAALLSFRRPEVTINGKDVKVWGLREKEPLPLNILHWPFCVSLSYYQTGSDKQGFMLADANWLEEQVRDGELVISSNRFGEVCQIAKLGGAKTDATALLGHVKNSIQKVKELHAILEREYKQLEERRNAGGIMEELRAENAR